MRRFRRLLALGPALLVLGACASTVVTPNRVTLGDDGLTPQTVVVSPNYEDPFVRCIQAEDNAEIFIDGEFAAAGDVGADGDFAVEVEAPGELGSYEVHAECDAADMGPFGGAGRSVSLPRQIGDRLVMEPDWLVVVPALTMAADPDLLDPGQTFEVTGNYCISQHEDGIPPVVTIEFEGQERTATSSPDPQPFDGTWTVEFTAPDEPGTYPVDAECVYDEQTPDPFAGFFEEIDDIVIAQAEPSDPQPYPTVEVTVVEEEPAPTTTTTEAPATTTTVAEVPRAPQPAPAAQPVTAAPTFTA